MTNLSLQNNDETSDGGDDATIVHTVTKDTLLHIVDCAMYTLHINKDALDAVHTTLELVCAIISHDELLAGAMMERILDYGTVSKDLIRMEAVHMLSWLCGVWLTRPTSILKKASGSGNSNHRNSRAKIVLEGWKETLVLQAGQALMLRCTDKITRVRSAAIQGGSVFFRFLNDNNNDDDENNSELKQVALQLQETLLWLSANDTSAANRALALKCLPVHCDDNVEVWVARLKDVDVKVREAALESLEKVAVEDLGEEEMVQILRCGLTKR